MASERTTIIRIYVTKELKNQIAKLSERFGIKMGRLIVDIVESHLEKNYPESYDNDGDHYAKLVRKNITFRPTIFTKTLIEKTAKKRGVSVDRLMNIIVEDFHVRERFSVAPKDATTDGLPIRWFGE